ncbi:MAG: aminotransferase class III-fold pyridoxal phosphate-dependent enzyme [Desulfobacterales bacterium]
MKTFDYTKSQKLFQRARKVIPGGIYGHYQLSAISPGNPTYFSKARGARFWDIDDNEFIDYVCAYGPMILGYNHPMVDEAAKIQYEKGNTVSLAAPVMVELAEALVDMVSIADWAYFTKNGADPTNLATMVARAATGRKKIVMVNGHYHGTTPWMQGKGSAGTIDEERDNIIRTDWNDYEGFEKVVNDYGDDIAGFIAMPYHHITTDDNVLPDEGYWSRVEALCNKRGIVLIMDDVRLGFRADLRGSNEYFGFKPDLICFGKALGNGYPISALVGTDTLRDAVSSVFFTGTQFYNAAPMAAALATLKELKRIDGPNRMLDTGRKIMDGMIDIADDHGYDLKVTGLPSMPYIRLTTKDDPTLTSGPKGAFKGLHADWISECVQRGAFFLSFHNHFISTGHTEADMKRTWDIVADACKAVQSRYQ